MLAMWNSNLALFSQSQEAVSSKMDISELHHVMKHVISSSSEFYVENLSKDEQQQLQQLLNKMQSGNSDFDDELLDTE